MEISNTDYRDRPRPLRTEAALLAKLLGVGGSLALALVGWGVITAVQGDAIVGLLGLIPGAVNAVTTLLTAFGLAARAEHLVTPISSPRNNAGQDLVPATTGGSPGDFSSGFIYPEE